MEIKSKYASLLQTLGPGFLLAGAAIGVSHLVQATRAGADYGLIMIVFLALACISKYPFLEFGPRYFAATGKNLISGYKALGKFPFYSCMVITIGTMFVIQASVTVVTAGLAEQLFGFGLSAFVWSIIILAFCIALLLIGKYPGLDLSMKTIVSFLAVVTLVAVLMSANTEAAVTAVNRKPPSVWNRAGLAFIISFMGWMPIPIDASIWHSIWAKAKSAQNGLMPRKKNAFIDFNVGYLSAAVMGLLFLLLGFFVMFGTEQHFANNSIIFSAQLIELYGQTLGEWSKFIISVAAFVTMLSTTLTVTDAYPRVFSEFLFSEETETTISVTKKWNVYWICILIVPTLALFILFFMGTSFTRLIDFATALSFLSAPFLAWFNYKLVTGNQVAEKDKPGKYYRAFSLFCFGMLVIFTFIYLYTLV
ncbi:MAG TPA: divalent metal cation transporter [Flavobacteriaceae bacterium]|nr:divalent metal cation transporter [Flavobacteriaceae bacterium]